MYLYIFYGKNKLKFSVKENTPLEDCFKWASQFVGTALVSIDCSNPFNSFMPEI